MRRIPPWTAVVLLAAALAAGCLAGSGQGQRPNQADSLAAMDSVGVGELASQQNMARQGFPIDVPEPGFPTGVWRPHLSPPRLVAGGRLDWGAREERLVSEASLFLAELGDGRAAQDSTRAWQRLASQPTLGLYARHRLAVDHLTRGDSAAAESLWVVNVRTRLFAPTADSLDRALVSLAHRWQWKATRGAADLALARGDSTRAGALIESAEVRLWPEADITRWLLARARLRLAAGDPSSAIAMCRRALLGRGAHEDRKAAGVLLESLRRARHETLRADASYAVADLALRPPAGPPDLSLAVVHLRRAFRDDTTELKRDVGLRLATTLRRRRLYTESLRSIDETLRLAETADDTTRAWLARARTLRDARRQSAAYAMYRRAAATAHDVALVEQAWWELGREAESHRSWSRARDAYRELVSLGGAQRDDGARRGGLLWLAEGHRDSALAWFERGADEGSLFWRAVILKGNGVAAGDSLLQVLAQQPDYRFYTHAARETLGLRGWPGQVRTNTECPGGKLCQGLDLARDLAVLGARDDARQVLERWDAVIRQHAALIGSNARSHVLLHASRVAYAVGAFGPATLFAARAGQAAPNPQSAWQMRPWRYPPAHDSLFAALPDSADQDGIERALMQGLAWQESKFDPRARSRANALGLVQLMIPTAGDVARWLREPRPDEEALFDTDRNLRYGVRYMRYLLGRFDNNVAVALAAYNGGPGRISKRWRELRARGGDALICEMVSVAASNAYAKRVLSLRQAYREMRPTAASR